MEAVANLKAFSEENPIDADNPPPAGLTTLPADTPEVNACLGWAEFSGDYVRFAGKRAGYGIAEGNSTFYCIIYDLVERRDLDPRQIVATSTFFHTLGFSIEPFNSPNWWGRGLLVDYGDIVPPLRGCWGFNDRMYARQREWMDEMGLLTGPRSRPTNTFIRL
ncbi:hypothetical protein C8A05DRAFT_35049 [Staphylotrichum tortipilum]|uniref:Uncharacterized protein n=1 Tax=Staphylotrichum tortipilum TaxID=2831512 RepID=A0AAN6MI32_9PEZI|nr:hypothetical protein C8A05DRAFT_35049 [Staphylotrichum longicolle]